MCPGEAVPRNGTRGILLTMRTRLTLRRKGGESGTGGVVIVPNTPSAEIDFQ